MRPAPLRQLLAIVFLLVGAISLQGFTQPDQTVTLTGTVSCSRCQGSHLLKARTIESCVNFCVSHGASYVLLVGDKAYKLYGVQSVNPWVMRAMDLRQDTTNTQALASLAGRRATVTGYLNGDIFSVVTVDPAKNEKKHKGDKAAVASGD